MKWKIPSLPVQREYKPSFAIIAVLFSLKYHWIPENRMPVAEPKLTVYQSKWEIRFIGIFEKIKNYKAFNYKQDFFLLYIRRFIHSFTQ